MASIEDRLKEKFGTLKKENEEKEQQKQVVIIEEAPTNLEAKEIHNLYKKSDFSFIDDITDNDEDRVFLKEKTLALLTIDKTSKIVLGGILQEIFEKIGNYKNGTYENWLSSMKISQRTALRYRNRFNLYKKVKSENAKKIMLEFTNEEIEEIRENEVTENKIIEILERGESKEFALEYIKKITYISDDEKKELEEKIEKNSIPTLSREIEERWETFDKRKQNKISKLFSKIRKIISE